MTNKEYEKRQWKKLFDRTAEQPESVQWTDEELAELAEFEREERRAVMHHHHFKKYRHDVYELNCNGCW